VPDPTSSHLLPAWEWFALCPSCRRKGATLAVRVEGQQKTATYVCSECDRSWEVSSMDDRITFQPKTTEGEAAGLE
jgi:protein-arginine kinase activator protein McsA